MQKTRLSSSSPPIGEIDQALLMEIRLVVAVVLVLALTLLSGWKLIA